MEMEMEMEMEKGSSSGVKILERLKKGEISDEEIKKHIRVHWDKRLQWGYKPTFQEQLQSNLDFIKSLKEMEISGEVEIQSDEVYNNQKKKKSNELPSEYLGAIFGKTLKQSACYFKDESMSLDEAEEAAYELYCERAQIKDGQTVIDIGCGHGGLVLYIAQKYKNCHVTGLTNSTTHVNYIEMQSKKLQLSNVDVILADVTKYDTEKTFDRIVVIGTIEHMKNIGLFMKKLSTWMKKESLLFVDHICHISFNYHLEAMDEDDWYSEYIFPKGSVTFLSSSALLYFQGTELQLGLAVEIQKATLSVKRRLACEQLSYFAQEDVSVVDHWLLSGMHWARSMQEWNKKIEQNMETLRGILEQTVEGGSKEAVNQVVTNLRTRCIGGYETFSSNNGEELMMAHFLFKKK